MTEKVAVYLKFSLLSGYALEGEPALDLLALAKRAVERADDAMTRYQRRPRDPPPLPGIELAPSRFEQLVAERREAVRDLETLQLIAQLLDE
jgi:hypothetical protein